MAENTNDADWRLSVSSAFPVPCPGSSGMTLLEYFAGQALVGMMAYGSTYGVGHELQDAERAFNLAEAMVVEARKRRGTR